MIVHNTTEAYLFYNGERGGEQGHGRNVLTRLILAKMPHHASPRVIYGQGNCLGRARLERKRITFKQIPYEIKVR